MKTQAKSILSLADKLTLGDVFKGQQYEDIVRACSSHYELVEALKSAQAYINDDYVGTSDDIKYVIEQALAKAGA